MVIDGIKYEQIRGQYYEMRLFEESEVEEYLNRETKSTHDTAKRRTDENKKIKCGKAHFSALGVDFKVATTIHEVLAG